MSRTYRFTPASTKGPRHRSSAPYKRTSNKINYYDEYEREQ